MKLIDTILENISISFSGRVNILSKEDNQFIGSIIQLEGIIINANFKGLEGKKALASILMEARSQRRYSIVTEPELIEPKEIVFEMTEHQFFKFKNEYYEQHDLLEKLRPGNHLRFSLNGDKIDVYTPLTTSEFEVMKVIVDDSLVSNIYKNCSMLDFDVTKSLVSLRKKGAILVHNRSDGE